NPKPAHRSRTPFQLKWRPAHGDAVRPARLRLAARQDGPLWTLEFADEASVFVPVDLRHRWTRRYKRGFREHQHINVRSEASKREAHFRRLPVLGDSFAATGGFAAAGRRERGYVRAFVFAP